MTFHGLFLESNPREIMYHRDFSDRQQLSPSARADSYGAALFRLPILSNSQESFLVSWKPLKEVMVPLSCVSDLVCLGVDLFSQSVVTVNSHSNWDLCWWAPWSDETEDGGCYSCRTTCYNFSISQTSKSRQSQIPWRLFWSHLVETLNWGPLCIYTSKKVMYAC